MMSREPKNSSRGWLILMTVICVLTVSAFTAGNALSDKAEMTQTNKVQSTYADTTSQQSSPEARTELVAGSEVDFKLKDLSGKSVSLSDYRGKVVLVNFWATWCGPCQFEIPVFVKMKRRYQRRGFEVIGISMDDGALEQIEEFITQYKINYPVVMGGETRLNGFGRITGLPTSFLVDRQGRVHSRHQGLLGLNEIENQLPKLLAAK